MQISCQSKSGESCTQSLNTLEELCEFINNHPVSSYNFHINSVIYQLLKITTCEWREHPKILLNVQGKVLPQELTITHLDDFHYFLSQYPSPQYLLEINSALFKMQKIVTIVK